jgi:TorA maturation chaperone TorD
MGEKGRVSGGEAADLVRAGIYALLAQLLAKPPTAALLGDVARLEAADSGLGQAVGELAARAGATSPYDVEREHNALFIGVDRGELVPYASFYRTGFLSDRPLARLRQDMAALGVERQPGVPEPEDHVAAICEIMAGLVTGQFGDADDAAQRRFFDRHLAPWASRFFADLERARAARFYRPVGTIGRLFLEIESESRVDAAPAESPPARPASMAQQSMRHGESP